MQTIKLFLCALLLSLIPGQLVRIQLNQNNAVTITDILVTITIAIFFFYTIINKKTILVPGKIFVLGILFTISAISSSIFALTNFKISEVLISSLFIVRLSAYFLLSVVVATIIKKAEVENWLKLLTAIAVVFTLLGFFQFVFFKDLSFLEQYGWDPHVSRLVSTTLDPNYTGGLLVIFSTISISFFLYKKKIFYLFLTAIFTVALFLTFSRSSYLSYLTAMSLIGIIKSPKIIIIAFFLFLFSFIFFASVRERIIGAFLIDKTANARIESWQKAIVIFRERPVFGVGFNAYRYAQAQHGFVMTDTGGGGHSGAGVDSTFLLVAATTGLVGFSLYIGWLATIFNQLKKNYKKSPINLAVFASFFAILVHTQFVNSLFYPQIMLILWFFIGLQFVNDY
jgi:O-antigen ligase